MTLHVYLLKNKSVWWVFYVFLFVHKMFYILNQLMKSHNTTIQFVYTFQEITEAFGVDGF